MLKQYVILFCLFSSSTNAAEMSLCNAKTLRAARAKATARLKQDPIPDDTRDFDSLWNACKYEFSKNEEVQWLASDFAYYLLKTNQNRRCEEQFCEPHNYVYCHHPRQKQPWDKELSKANKAFEFNVKQCLKKSETGLTPDELANEYKSKRTSTAAICKTSKKFKHVRVKKYVEESEDEYAVKNEKELIVIGDTEKEVSAALPIDSEAYLEWAGDLNSDGLNDLLVNQWGCTPDGCPYELLINCGKGKYASVLEKDESGYQWMYEPRVLKSVTKVGTESWRDIESGSRSRDVTEGCDEAIYDFVISSKLQFNGEVYKVSAAENAELEKQYQKEKARIKKACAKQSN